MPYNVKLEVQNNITDVDLANKSEGLQSTKLTRHTTSRMVQTLSYKLMPNQMAGYQKRDTQIPYVYEHIANNSKPKLSEIHHIRSKPICRLLLQFDLTLFNMGLFCIITPLRMTMKYNS